MTTWPVARCTSDTCRAPIVWARTERGSRMPVDPDPSPGGSVLLDGDGPEPVARVIAKGERDGRTDLHASHFQTCPDAGQFRGGRADRPRREGNQ